MSITKWVIHNNQMYRRVLFEQYKDALDFVMKVGRVAELKDHHPKIIINYMDVELFLYTHDKNAITDKDEDLAEMIDQIIDEIDLKK